MFAFIICYNFHCIYYMSDILTNSENNIKHIALSEAKKYIFDSTHIMKDNLIYI